MHVNVTIFNQLPSPNTQKSFNKLAIGQPTVMGDWLKARILELTYTAWDLELFAKGCGYNNPPFRWDEERRLLLRPSSMPPSSTSTWALLRIGEPVENQGF